MTEQCCRSATRSTWAPRRPYFPTTDTEPVILSGIGTSSMPCIIPTPIKPAMRNGFSWLYKGVIPGKLNDILYPPDKLHEAFDAIDSTYRQATGVSSDENGFWYLTTGHYLKEQEKNKSSYFYLQNSALIISDGKHTNTIARFSNHQTWSKRSSLE